MYNKSAFNLTPFNLVDTESASIFATISSEFAVQAASLKVQALLSPAVLSAESGVQVAALGMLAPIGETSLGAEYGVSASLRAMMPLPDASIGAEFNLAANTVRAAEYEEMVLEGLNLQPGQTLIIDTDTLEIEVDNEIRVDCWVTGGTFFQFKAGDNNLSLTDNAQNRKLSVTVLWADRYL